MTYSLKDVDEAEALVMATLPGTIISRDDFDWSLSIRGRDSTLAYILFQPRIEDIGQHEIRSSQNQIKDILFWMRFGQKPPSMMVRKLS